MFYVDLYLKFKDRFNYFICYFIGYIAAKHLMENQSIYNKICNIQISPHNFDPARLLSVCLLHSLNICTVSMWVAIFHQKAKTIYSLSWLLYKSFFYGLYDGTVHMYCTVY